MSEEEKQAILAVLKELSDEISLLRPGGGWSSDPAEAEIKALEELWCGKILTGDRPMTSPLEAMAKAIAQAAWHNDPERHFTDELWEREVRWWRDPDNRSIKETFFAAKCFRQARAALLALAEVELPFRPLMIAASLASRTIADEVYEDELELAFRAMLRSIAEGER